MEDNIKMRIRDITLLCVNLIDLVQDRDWFRFLMNLRVFRVLETS